MPPCNAEVWVTIPTDANLLREGEHMANTTSDVIEMFEIVEELAELLQEVTEE